MMIKQRYLAVLAAFYIGAATTAVGSENGADRVFTFVLESCRNYVTGKTGQLEHEALLPISGRGEGFLSARIRSKSQFGHLFNEKYVVAWGDVGGDRHCIMQSDIASEAEKMLLVDPQDFLETATASFKSIGFTLITKAESIAKVDVIPTWASVDVASNVESRIVLVGMDIQDGLIDVGMIVYSSFQSPLLN